MKSAATPRTGRDVRCPCGSGQVRDACCATRPPAARAATLPVPVPPAPAPDGPRVPPASRAEDRAALVLACTFVLAFCSIVYELLLGQTLSAFLGNTVLRYSVTIGLYMLSMGMGALLAGRRLLRSPILSLQVVELALTVLGGGSVLGLFAADAAGAPPLLLSIVAHALVVVVGVLTGLEIPLLIEARSALGGRDGAAERAAPGEVLGVDYAGAFAGTVLFALVFYPRVGLVATAFGVASLNAAVGLLLGRFGGGVPDGRRRLHRGLLAAQASLLVVLLVALAFSSNISELAIAQYLRG